MDAQEIPVTAEKNDTGAAEGIKVVDATRDDDLAAQLVAIEAQPLEERAAGYTQLHDQLRARLEGGDVSAAAAR